MKKRILSCLMALALCLTLLPATALATDGHAHCLCGKTPHTNIGDHTEKQIIFDKWLASGYGINTSLTLYYNEANKTSGEIVSQDNSKNWVLEDGNYYLKTSEDGFNSDVTIEHPIQIKGIVTICLNGKTIQSKDESMPVFVIVSGGTLTLTDCGSAGKVTHASGVAGCGVRVESGTFNMYGGAITKNTADYGGGVLVKTGTTFNMYGGSITNNTATNSGGVFVSGTNSKFTMNGGTIAANQTNSYETGKGNGGGVGVYNGGTFEMNGKATSVSNNTATGDGGGVYVRNGGSFNMYSGTITGNDANGSSSNGGGVYVTDSRSKFTMTDGSITGNTATGNGGGVYVTGGTFDMTDGTIGGTGTGDANTATNGGGVYVEGGEFTMNGGTTSVSNNTATNDGGGVYVKSGTFNMNDGTIGGATAAAANTATNGGGVYVLNGTFNMNGNVNGNASITGNKASQDGGGVCASGGTFAMNGSSKVMNNTGNGVYVIGGKFTVSGAPTVTGNTKDGDASNVYLTGSEIYITIGGKLTGDKGSIGVTKRSNSVIAKGSKDLTEADAAKFKSDKDGYAVSVDTDNSKQLVLKKAPTPTPEHKHRYGDWSKDGTNHWHECTDADCPNREESIKDKAAHIYDDDAGTTCNICGYVRTVTPEIIPVSQITLNKTETSISVGNSETLTATVAPENATIKALTWASSDEDVATVAPDGTVTAVKVGTATITATATDGSGKSAVCKVTVTGDTTPPAHEHRYGDWRKDGTNHWHECTDAACPNRNESITDKAAHVYDDDADTTCDTCGYERTVTPETVPVSQITLNKAETSISVGNSETLTATVAPENATIKALTWASSDEDVATVAPDGTVTAVKVGTATITATAADGSDKSAVCTVTVTGGTTPSQPGGSTGGSSGGSSSDRDSSDSNPVIKTETKNNADGSTTKTETRRDGSVTQTTTGKDGSVSKTETKPDGSSVTENKAADGSTGTVKTDKNGKTEINAKLSDKAVEDAKKSGEAVKVPVEVEATRNSNTAPVVKVELPKGAGETKVEIPVSNVTPGTVAVLVRPDGTEEILKDSIPTEDGIRLTVDGSATVKIIDNSKDFIDTRNHWAEDEIDFVSARGLVNGMSATIYAPNASTTRAQLWTILARQADADLTGGNTWYEKAQNWAKDKGVSDGANPNAAINRAQMVTMLWRAVGQPTAGGAVSFTDVPADAYYAQAVSWAVENGITTGVGNGHFDPTGTCTRAQIAAFLARSMK